MPIWLQVIKIYETNIDDFFEYAFRQNIGTEAQLTSHIAALKSLFGFWIDKNKDLLICMDI